MNLLYLNIINILNDNINDNGSAKRNKWFIWKYKNNNFIAKKNEKIGEKNNEKEKG